MRAILLRLELLSHGSTQAWNGSGGHSGEPDDRMVGLIGSTRLLPHIVWRRLYDQAASDERRADVIDAAGSELADWTRRSAPAPGTAKSLTDLIVEDGEGHDPRSVGQRFGVDAAFVRRIRHGAGLDTETGRKPEPVVPTGNAEKAERARELRARGLTLRQIALHLRIGVGNVHRILSDASATVEQFPGRDAPKPGSQGTSDA